MCQPIRLCRVEGVEGVVREPDRGAHFSANWDRHGLGSTQMTAVGGNALDGFLAGIEGRALIVAELATRDREEALDIVQDAMLAFARHYARKPETEWRPLFYRVLQNKVRDWRRRNAVRRRWRVWFRGEADTQEAASPVEAFADPAAMLPEDAVDNDAALATLLGAMGELPERQRQ